MLQKERFRLLFSVCYWTLPNLLNCLTEKLKPAWNHLKILHDQLFELAVCTDSTITAACRTGAGITPVVVLGST